MLVVGLTGGIATGKSTVCRMLEDRGAYIVDTDVIAREVVKPGQPGWQEVVNFFGEDIVCPDGRLDRKKLGAIVFNEPWEREMLEKMLHPKIFVEKERKIKEIEKRNPRSIVIIDIPLLLELNRQNSVDAVILVYVSPQVQIERLTRRDDSGLDDAQSRIGSQMPIDDKVQYAHFVINNEGTVEETEKAVAEVYDKLKELESKKWTS